MKVMTNKEIKRLFIGILTVIVCFIMLYLFVAWMRPNWGVSSFLLLSLLMGCAVLALCYCYFLKQNRIVEAAVSQINDYLNGNVKARIECDEEGELYKLFHSINTLAAVLNTHTENELKSKEFLKNTISDVSHQLKTPLTALNIYNGILQSEADGFPSIQQFAALSEQELDRMETLVQNLLKITKLDAGTILLDKAPEGIAELMCDVQTHFAYRAEQEQKELSFAGADDVLLCCDRAWMIEAVSNLVKNALDHTEPGDRISVEWKQSAGLVQILVRDTGSGIHPEDLYHIFKRFYRSRFSQDTQGVGLGLSLTKAIVELHDGSITVDSDLGKGSVFSISFLIPTKL